MLLTYNSRITLMKLFTFIDILEVSRIQRIFYEKLNFSILISGDLHKCIFLFCSIFLFSESNALLSHRNRVEFQDLRVTKKNVTISTFFTKILSRCAQWRSCFAVTVSCEREAGLNINKLCDFVMNEKNNTFISCVLMVLTIYTYFGDFINIYFKV